MFNGPKDLTEFLKLIPAKVLFTEGLTRLSFDELLTILNILKNEGNFEVKTLLTNLQLALDMINDNKKPEIIQ